MVVQFYACSGYGCASIAQSVAYPWLGLGHLVSKRDIGWFIRSGGKEVFIVLLLWGVVLN